VNLIRLPVELMDYTILHELVHTRIKDHSARFWKELGKYVADPVKVDQELNQYGPMLLSMANRG
jgi:predicted metal-dependent hydrolase